MANQVTINKRYLTYNKAEAQDILDSVSQIDDTPTDGSQYPVKSGGVKAALDNYTTTSHLNELLAGKQDSMTVAQEADVRSIVTGYSGDDSSSSEA